MDVRHGLSRPRFRQQRFQRRLNILFFHARTAEAEVAVVPLAPARIVEIGIAAPPGRPSPALAAFEAFAVPRLQREAR